MVANDLRRNPSDQGIRWNILDDDGTGRDDRTISDGHTLQDRRVDPDPDVITDHDRLGRNVPPVEDGVIVRVLDRHVLSDRDIMADLDAVEAEDFAVAIDVAATELELGIFVDDDLATGQEGKITLDDDTHAVPDSEETIREIISGPFRTQSQGPTPTQPGARPDLDLGPPKDQEHEPVSEPKIEKYSL